MLYRSCVLGYRFLFTRFFIWYKAWFLVFWLWDTGVVTTRKPKYGLNIPVELSAQIVIAEYMVDFLQESR